MPEFRPFKMNDSYDALELEYMSPEEAQAWSRIFPPDIPEGSVLTVQKCKSKNGRPAVLVGVTKVGESIPLIRDEKGEPAPVKPAPIPAALTIPPVVHNATDKQLEVMAARNGCLTDKDGKDISDQWAKKTIEMRRAIVAKALKSNNAR